MTKEKLRELLQQMEEDYDALAKTHWQSERIKEVAMMAKGWIGFYVVSIKEILKLEGL